MNDKTKDILSFIIGHRIRKLRKERRISQSELGNALGSQSLMSLIESGRQFPAEDILHELSTRLDDPYLESMAQQFDGTVQIDVHQLIEDNKNVLTEAIATFNGTMTELHQEISYILCETYYTEMQFDVVKSLCMQIMNHSSIGAPNLTKAMYYIGSVALFEINYKEAQRWLTMAEETIDNLDDPFKARLFYNLGYLYTQQFLHGKALRYATLAAEKLLHLKEYISYAKAMGLTGVIEQRLGYSEQAEKSLRGAYEITSKLGKKIDIGRMECSLAEVYLALRRYDEAEVWGQKARETGRDSGDILTVCVALENIGLAKIEQGLFSEAQKALSEAVSLGTMLDSTSRAEIFLAYAKANKNTEKKLKIYHEALEVLHDTDNALLKAIAAEQIAKLESDAERAERHRDMALDYYHEYAKQSTSIIVALKLLE